MHRTTAQRAADGRRRWTTRSTRPAGTRSDTEVHARLGAHHGRLHAAARREAARGQVPRLRLVQPAVAAGAARPGRRPRWPAPGSPAGTGCRRAAARVPRRLLGRAPTSRSRATPRCSRRCASALFHVLQAGARAERRPIPAKGLTGPGLRRARLLGHRDVRAAGADLHPARARPPTRCAGGTPPWTWPGSGPQQLGLRGRRLPVADDPRPGVLGYWPAGTAAFHINADIADAVRPLRARPPATTSSSAEVGLELLVETARLWRSLGHHDRHGRFHIDGVTGPDEYSARRRRQRLHQPDGAAEPARRGRRRRAPPGRGRASSASTTRRRPPGATRPTPMHVPVRRGARRAPAVARASPGYQEWDFDGTPPEHVPAAAALPVLRPVPQAGGQAGRPGAGDALVRRRVHRRRRRRATSPTTSARTVRDSSLSACTQAVMAAEVGHLDLAYDYLHEAALMDLRDLHHNTRDGLHMASLAGAWMRAGRRLRRHARPRRRGCPSTPRCPPASSGWRSRCAGATRWSTSPSTAPRRRTGCAAGDRQLSSSGTPASRSRWAPTRCRCRCGHDPSVRRRRSRSVASRCAG